MSDFDVRIVFSTETKDAARDVDKLGNQTERFFKQLRRGAKDATQSFGSFATKLNQTLEILGKGTRVLGAVTRGLTTVGRAGIQTGQHFATAAAQVEVYQTRLGTLLGSAEAAEKRLKSLTEVASKNPFELSSIIEAETTLEDGRDRDGLVCGGRD